MIIDLESLFNIDGLSKDIDYNIDMSAEELDGSFPFAKPVSVKGHIFNKAGIVELDAVAAMIINTDCDRCAKPISYPFSVHINHILVTSLNDENNDDLLLVNEFRFNLDELVIDDIFLNLPLKFLCSDECKGLCPQCGKDLNEGECGCKKSIDPRLQVLQQLLND